MNRTISESLVSIMLVIFAFMATNCPSQKSDTYLMYSASDGIYSSGTKMMVSSDSFVFDRDNVTLDFSYGLYNLDYDTFEETKNKRENYNEEQNYHLQSNYAIYLSQNSYLHFGDNKLSNLTDIENDVNAQLYKHFTYYDAFSKNYGFTTTHGDVFNHSEKLTIPAKYLDLPKGYVYIFLVSFSYDVINDDFDVLNIESLYIDYINNEDTVELINHTVELKFP